MTTETALVPETPTNPTKPDPAAAVKPDPAAVGAPPTEGPATGQSTKEEVVKEEAAAAVKTEGGAEGGAEADLGKIKGLLEFYFGDANYRRDKFLQNEAAKDADGFIKISVLLTFNKLKAITTDPAVVARALEHGEPLSTVELNADKTSVKRVGALPETDDRHTRTLFVEGIPKAPLEGHAEVTVDDIVALFQPHGAVAFVRLGRDKETKKITGSCFVEFEKESEMFKAIEAGWKDRTVVLGGKPVKLKVRKYEKDRKAQVALQRAKELTPSEVGQKRKAGGDPSLDVPADGSTIYDFDVPENFEKELLTLIPRHVKFTGIPHGSTFVELRDFFSQYGRVKYVTYDHIKGQEALVKFLLPETAAKFLGENPEVKEVKFKDTMLAAAAATEPEVRQQLHAKNARKRANLESPREHNHHHPGGRGGGHYHHGGRGRGGGRGGGFRGRGAKRGRRG